MNARQLPSSEVERLVPKPLDWTTRAKSSLGTGCSTFICSTFVC
jgi:hypothetical protein